MRVVKTGLVAAALLMAATVCAQEKHDKKTPEERAKLRTERMMEKLSLTDDQQTKMTELNLEAIKKRDEIRSNASLNDEQKREAMKAYHQEIKTKVDSLLTEEQRTQLKEKHAAMKAEGEKHREQWKNATPEQRAQMKTEHMAKKLSLTEEQKKKLTDLHLSTDKKMETLRANTALTDEQRKAEMKSIHETKRKELKQILTEEQLKQLKEHKHSHGDEPEEE